MTLPPDAEAAWHEYLYRHHVMPGMTHDAYLDEPGMTIAWNTRIFHLEEQVKKERQKH